MAGPWEDYGQKPADDGPWSDYAATPAAPPPKSGLIRRGIGDTAVSLVKGAVAVPEAAVGLADIATGGRVGKALENKDGAIGFRPAQARAALDELYSPEQQAANRAVEDAQGFIPTAQAMLQNPSTIAQGVAQSLPLMGAGGLVGRGITKAAPGVGKILGIGAGEGIVGAGSQAESIRQQTDDGLLTPKQAALAAGTGAATGVITAGSGRIANRLGIGDIDQMILTGQMGGSAAKKGITRRAVEGVLTEGVLEEAPQSMSEQALQNLALDRPVGEGVGSAAAQGLLTGGLMGAATGPLIRNPGAQAAAPAPAQPAAPNIGAMPTAPTPGDAIRATAPPVTGPLTGALAAGTEAAAQAADAGVAPLPVGQAQALSEEDRAALAAQVDPEGQQLVKERRRAIEDRQRQEFGQRFQAAGPEARELSLEEAAALAVRPTEQPDRIPVGRARELPVDTVEPADAGGPDLLRSKDVKREPRTPKPQATRDMTDADVVAAYVEQRRTEGTLAGRRFAGDFDAGRITPADVLALVRPNVEPTPDERLAAAAAQAPKPRGGIQIPPASKQPRETSRVDQPDASGTARGTAAAGAGRAPVAGGSGVAVGRVAADAGQRQPGSAAATVAGGREAGPAGNGSAADAPLTTLQARREAAKAQRKPTLMDKMTEAAGGPVTFGDLKKADAAAQTLNAANEQSDYPERFAASGWASGMPDARTRWLDRAGVKDGSPEYEAAIEAPWAALPAGIKARVLNAIRDEERGIVRPSTAANAAATAVTKAPAGPAEAPGVAAPEDDTIDPFTLDKAALNRRLNQIVSAGGAPDLIRAFLEMRKRYMAATGKPSIPPAGSRAAPMYPDAGAAPKSAETATAEGEFIRKATSAERMGSKPKQRAMVELSAQIGRPVVFKPYGSQGAGFYAETAAAAPVAESLAPGRAADGEAGVAPGQGGSSTAPTQPKTLKERREAARQAQQDKEAAAGVVTWQRKPPRDGLPGSLVHRFTTTEGMDGQVLISPPGWRKGVKSFVVSFDRTGGPLDEKGRTKFYPTVDIGKYKTEEAARIAAEKVIAENRKATTETRAPETSTSAQPAPASESVAAQQEVGSLDSEPKGGVLPPGFRGMTWRQAVDKIVAEHGRAAYIDGNSLMFPSGRQGQSNGIGNVPADVIQYATEGLKPKPTTGVDWWDDEQAPTTSESTDKAQDPHASEKENLKRIKEISERQNLGLHTDHMRSDGLAATGWSAESVENAANAMIPPVVRGMSDAAQKSIEALRERVSNVRYVPTDGNTNDITFKFDGKPMIGSLRGRNADAVLRGKDAEGDRALAVRTMLDGDATTAPASDQQVPPADATHKDPGEPAEPVTAEVVAEVIEKAAKNTDRSRSEMKAEALRLIDEAIAKAPEKGDKKTTISVPGDGVFKVVNNVTRLKEFRRQIELSPGFKDKLPAYPIGKAVSGGNYGPDQLAREMLEDGEPVNAVEILEAAGKTMMFGNGNGASIPYTNAEPVEIAGIDDLFVGRGFGTKKGATSWWSVVHKGSGFAIGGSAGSKAEAIAEAQKLLGQPEKREKMRALIESGKSADGRAFMTQDELREQFMTEADGKQQATFNANDANIARAATQKAREDADAAFYASIMGANNEAPKKDDWTQASVVEFLNAAEKAGKVDEAQTFLDGAVREFVRVHIADWRKAYDRRNKPTDTGWQTGFQAPGGYRRIRRDVTLPDGTTFRAELDERAGAYTVGMVQRWSTDNGTPRNVMTFSNDMDARKRADDYLDQQATSAKPKPADDDPPALDLMGFERIPKGNGAFELRDSNMRVSVEPTERGKYRASMGSGKSGPNLTEQQAVEWAAAYRAESLRVQAADAKKAATPAPQAPEPEARAEPMGWHTPLPERGEPSTQQDRTHPTNAKAPVDARKVSARLAAEAFEAITPAQQTNLAVSGMKLYPWVLPAQGNRNGVVRLLPEDQRPGAPWQQVGTEPVNAGGVRNLAINDLTARLGREPIIGDEATAARDTFYESLIGRASTEQMSSSGGRTIYSVKITPLMASRQGVEFGRWPETESFALKRMADVTGRPADEGWALIDKRQQAATRAAAEPVKAKEGAPAPAAEAGNVAPGKTSGRAQTRDGVAALFQEALEAGQRGAGSLSNLVSGRAFLRQLGQAVNVPSDAGTTGEASQLVDTDAAASKSRLDRVRRHAKALTDILGSGASAKQGGSGLNVKTQRLVLPHVLALGQDSQVLQAVVQLVPVDVVNDLVARQLTPESLFNDAAVVELAVAGNLGDTVALRGYAADTFVRSVALAGAEVSSGGVAPNLEGPAEKVASTSGARDGDLRHGGDDTRNGGQTRTDEAGNVAMFSRAASDAVRAGDVFKTPTGEAATVTRTLPGGRVEVRIQGKRTRVGEWQAAGLKEWPKIGRATYEDGVYTTPADLIAAAADDATFSRTQDTPRAQTDTTAFRKWFGDSKVVDAEGKPLVVYHGSTRAGFAVFDTDGSGKTAGTGTFFTTSNRGAATYSNSNKEAEVSDDPDFDPRYEGIAGNYPVYLSLQNPKIIDAEGKNWDSIGATDEWFAVNEDGDIVEYFTNEADANHFRDTSDDYIKIEQSLDRSDAASTDDIVRQARREGHDGVIILNVTDEGPFGQGYGWDNAVYVAFRPEQIKSATGNSGTFDPATPDIRYSRGDTPRGLSLDEAEAIVGAVREANPTAPPMIVLESVDQAPTALRRDIIEAGAANDVEAAYHEGKVYVFAPHLRSMERAMFVIAHHELRHHGMRSLEGRRLSTTLAGMVMSNPNLRDAARAKMDAGLAKDMIQGAEEALADMDVAEVQALKGWPKVLAAVRNWLRGMAARLRAKGHTTLADAIDPKDWTDADVAGFVARAEAVSKGGRAKFGTDGTVFGRAEDQTKTLAFRRWFGDSKVVDADGKPLVVYHGTNRDFSTFDPEQSREDGTLFVTPNKNVAGDFAMYRTVWGGANVMPLYVRAEKLLIVEGRGRPIRGLEELLATPRTRLADDMRYGESVRQYARRLGYDGILFKDVVDDVGGPNIAPVADIYALFESAQVKSATGNTGAFDGSNPDIRYSRAPRVTQDTHDGAPVFASDDITIAFPQDTERFEVFTEPGERVVNYAIMPAQGFDVLGHVELLIRDGKPVSLLDIEVTPAGRRAGTGRKVIETLLAANPDADLNISNIVQDARGFWERMGVPQQNLEQGAAYDGTINWRTYSQAQVAAGAPPAAPQGRAASQGRDTRAEGARRGAAQEAQGLTAFSRAEPARDAPRTLAERRAAAMANGPQRLSAQDLVDARGGVFDFNKLGETKQDRIRTIIDASRPGWLGLLTRDQIADVYGAEIPPVKEYDQLTRLMENERSKIAQDADDLYSEWSKLPADQNDSLARIMLDATVFGVNPDGVFTPSGTNDGERQQVHARIAAQFGALSPEARAMYGKVKDYHVALLTKLRTALEARIERQVEAGAARAAALTKIRQAFDSYLGTGPYFPLSRFGDFLVVANREEDGERVVASYATAGEQAAAARLLESDGFTVKMKTAKTYSRETDGAAGKFIGDVLVTLDKLDMSDATVAGNAENLKAKLLDDVNQLFIRALPDLSYRKHFMHRKGTPGFSSDMMRGFASSAFHAASHIARLNHADQMTFALQDAYTAIEQAPEGDFNLHSQVLNELTKRHEASLNPNTHPIAAMLNQIGFVMYLGLSPAAGIINMLQTVMVTMPHLGARYGFRKANASLAAALTDIMGAKANAKNGWNAAQSPKLSPEERAMMTRLQDEGVIDLTQAHDLASATGLDTGNVARSKAAFAMARAMKIVGWTFHIPEVMNRQVTALAAYRMEMKRSGDQDAAAEAAREAIKRTHFDYSASNRARFMQGNLARVVTQFKAYSQNMTYLLGRALHQALKGESPEVRSIARRQLVSTLGVTFAMAGTLGLPGLGAVGGALGILIGAMSDDDEPWDWKVELRNVLADQFGKETAEVLAHGIPRALLPWDISNRVSLGELWWRDNGREGQSPREAFASDMANILGPTAGTALGIYTMADHMAKGNWSKAAESIVPKFLRDPLKAIREGTEGVTSGRGEPLMDVTAAEVTGRALGFAPARASEMYEGKAAVMNAKTAIEERRQILVGRMAKARLDQDAEAVAEIGPQIAAFNERNPQFRITMATIAKAAQARRQNRARTEDGILLPRTKDELREIGRFAVTQ